MKRIETKRNEVKTFTIGGRSRVNIHSNASANVTHTHTLTKDDEKNLFLNSFLYNKLVLMRHRHLKRNHDELYVQFTLIMKSEIIPTAHTENPMSTDFSRFTWPIKMKIEWKIHTIISHELF